MSVHRHPASARHVNNEQDEGDQEQHPRDLARDGRNSEQSEGPRHQPHDQKDERVVEHPHLLRSRSVARLLPCRASCMPRPRVPHLGRRGRTGTDLPPQFRGEDSRKEKPCIKRNRSITSETSPACPTDRSRSTSSSTPAT